jgi:hypothetical protein
MDTIGSAVRLPSAALLPAVVAGIANKASPRFIVLDEHLSLNSTLFQISRLLPSIFALDL